MVRLVRELIVTCFCALSWYKTVSSRVIVVSPHLENSASEVEDAGSIAKRPDFLGEDPGYSRERWSPLETARTKLGDARPSRLSRLAAALPDELDYARSRAALSDGVVGDGARDLFRLAKFYEDPARGAEDLDDDDDDGDDDRNRFRGLTMKEDDDDVIPDVSDPAAAGQEERLEPAAMLLPDTGSFRQLASAVAGYLRRAKIIGPGTSVARKKQLPNNKNGSRFIPRLGRRRRR